MEAVANRIWSCVDCDQMIYSLHPDGMNALAVSGALKELLGG